MGSQGYEYVKTSRHNLKRRLLYVMGDKCCICGYDKCPTALEFHHLNPEEKDFSLAQNANVAFKKAAQELRKTILVCANCHREIHAELIDVSNLKSSFDENKYQEIIQELEDLKTRTIHYCKNCGKIVTKNADYCIDCFALARRVADRPDRETLKKLIRTLPFTEIANQYNVTDNTIRKWCDKENLPRKKQEINSYSDKDWELV